MEAKCIIKPPSAKITNSVFLAHQNIQIFRTSGKTSIKAWILRDGYPPNLEPLLALLQKALFEV
jgi:hypothetical protein